ncbi:hypothetical protein Marme_0656 [Marinomonas mediterranea MMB-1]|uniref:Uncharacterized protein n=1 Tax=Marinomonas mediterranea (strain ATCC 700492 / JCM 21426 / NBRC 103028 / MMB-1) TaxID=717774 RepID=F2K1U6_MARM1|nr:hypothetical protein Marme_0656 [Marinomonas mediterranea MMB-1]
MFYFALVCLAIYAGVNSWTSNDITFDQPSAQFLEEMTGRLNTPSVPLTPLK